MSNITYKYRRSYSLEGTSPKAIKQLEKCLRNESQAAIVLLDGNRTILFHNMNYEGSKEQEIVNLLEKNPDLMAVCCHMAWMDERIGERALHPEFNSLECVEIQKAGMSLTIGVWESANETVDVIDRCVEYIEGIMDHPMWSIERMDSPIMSWSVTDHQRGEEIMLVAYDESNDTFHHCFPN